uniref:RxLR effector protein n=1 Tax=Phytophthora agathidicida TaxID=1642459 RepID=A0A7G4WI44_9STRA|nr:PaRXLR55 [Phytophthora agathidicida]
MRLLLWVLLATLVTLLGSVDSASSTIATTGATHNIKVVDNAVADTHYINIKRSLRSSNQLADDEERASLPSGITKLLARAKDAYSKGKIKMYRYLLRVYKWWSSNKKPTSEFPKPQAPPNVAVEGLPHPVKPPGAQ